MYRRWATKSELIAFARDRGIGDRDLYADCGSLPQDLVCLVKVIVGVLNDPQCRGLLTLSFSGVDIPRSFGTHLQGSPELHEKKVAMFSRAVARGEIAQDTDTDAIIDRVVGPVYFRQLVSRLPVSDEFVDRVVAAALFDVRL